MNYTGCFLIAIGILIAVTIVYATICAIAIKEFLDGDFSMPEETKLGDK